MAKWRKIPHVFLTYKNPCLYKDKNAGGTQASVEVEIHSNSQHMMWDMLQDLAKLDETQLWTCHAFFLLWFRRKMTRSLFNLHVVQLRITFFVGTRRAWWSSDLSVWISIWLWEALWIWFDYELQVKERALELAAAMKTEDGVTGAVKAFFKHLPPRNPPTQPSPVPTGFFEPCFGSVRKCFGCSWVFDCMHFSFIV